MRTLGSGSRNGIHFSSSSAWYIGWVKKSPTHLATITETITGSNAWTSLVNSICKKRRERVIEKQKEHGFISDTNPLRSEKWHWLDKSCQLFFLTLVQIQPFRTLTIYSLYISIYFVKIRSDPVLYVYDISKVECIIFKWFVTKLGFFKQFSQNIKEFNNLNYHDDSDSKCKPGHSPKEWCGPNKCKCSWVHPRPVSKVLTMYPKHLCHQ